MKTKVHLPQSEAEWLATKFFTIQTKNIFGNQIRLALTSPNLQTKVDSRFLVTMIGGVPRDENRRQNLPLINKLYGGLATRLTEHQIPSLLYNHPGIGGSGGDWSLENLSSKMHTLGELATQIGDNLGINQHILIGTSAGGYIAARAVSTFNTRGHQVCKLILVSPAAYPEKVETVPYGPEFSSIIRNNWNIATSPIFTDISRFLENAGELLISFFEADNPPIPDHIQSHFRKTIESKAVQNYLAKYHLIEGVAHNFRKIIHKPNDNVIDNKCIARTITTFLDFITTTSKAAS